LVQEPSQTGNAKCLSPVQKIERMIITKNTEKIMQFHKFIVQTLLQLIEHT